ncbi:tRNA pseudouridine(38-40) synthase TruA [Methyloligella solikamskensis]|uniref:tRNA pseudouridine synthase A n=1 Tax=Methyloligella solikamskensis TaxID=1177756 RepID=A0ABW3JCY1_9HYPH
MPRYKLTIEYDGTPYCGWQAQGDVPSVQEHLANAVKAFSGEDFIPRGAGRTDAGVHALGQVAHLDLTRDWEPEKVRDAMNAHLRPEPIVVLRCEAVGDDFDARFSATRRYYLYRIVNRRSPLALQKNRAWVVFRALDAQAMHEAAQLLVGRHDFSTFRAAECQANSPEKTLDAIEVTRAGDEIAIRTHARSFLHTQVRSMVGSLQRVGEGSWTAQDLKAALEARDRARCGPLAPPCGLYLSRVDY